MIRTVERKANEPIEAARKSVCACRQRIANPTDCGRPVTGTMCSGLGMGSGCKDVFWSLFIKTGAQPPAAHYGLYPLNLKDNATTSL